MPGVRNRARTGMAGLCLALVVVVAGCSGVLGAPTASPTTTGSSTTSDVVLQGLENATLWVDGTVERVDGRTLHVDDQEATDVVVPIRVREGGAVFRCTETDDGGLDCTPTSLADLAPGEPVCVAAAVRDGSLVAIKVFANATCQGPGPTR